MLFNSLIFLYLFLPVTYTVFWLLTRKTYRYAWLTLTGYIFYAAWNYKFCGLMAFSTLVAYLAGLALLRWQDPFRRRLCLIVPVAMDLALLGFFKYGNFVLDITRSGASWLKVGGHVPALDVVLPVGISFYTFHTVTYIVDAYRGVIRPTRNLFEFACYVSLFAQLVAGPIVRFRQIEGDLDKIDHAERAANRNIGCSFFVIGLAKKVLIADTIAAVIDPALLRYSELSTVGAWACMLGYTYQLYFDFSGYSDMAVGLGYLFGLRLPQNFSSPYKASDIADFWRRWHISLSSFLRDYLYVPLGGGRGSRLNVYRNLMLTMLLGGLWHGAHWTFVAWGGYHGLLLIAHRGIRPWWELLPRSVARMLTLFMVVVGWVLFRASDFGMAASLWRAMFWWQSGPSVVGHWVLLCMLALATVITQIAPNTFEIRHDWSPRMVGCLGLLFAACVFVIYGARSVPFLYFQF